MHGGVFAKGSSRSENPKRTRRAMGLRRSRRAPGNIGSCELNSLNFDNSLRLLSNF